MKTKVTTKPDVVRLPSDRAKRTRESSPAIKPFAIDARPMGLKAGMDNRRMGALLDDLEVNAFVYGNHNHHTHPAV